MLFHAFTVILYSGLVALAVIVARKPVVFVNTRIGLFESRWWLYSDGMSPNQWNVVVTIIGTAVGLVAIIAVASHDAFLSRMELTSAKGVAAIFLRPLTAQRGVEQVFSGRFGSIGRTVLFLQLVTTAFTAAATVALFSAQTSLATATFQGGSYPLSAYYEVYPWLEKQMSPSVRSFLYESARANAGNARARMKQDQQRIDTQLPLRLTPGE